jgi:type II secretory pathway pseudopilin PulG
VKQVRRRQDGYALLVILLALSVLVLTLAKAVPSWKTGIQRERENRMIDHAREYRTAIKRYFHKNGRYPASLDVLVQKDGNGIRYLRQAWPDPLNTRGDADGAWDVIHFGQADSAKIVDQPPAAAAGGSQTASSGSALGAGLAAGAGGAKPGTGPAPGALGTPVGTAGTGGTSGAGTTGPGGGPVIGVASMNKKGAVHSFNGFDTPNDWQFVYSYTMDPTLRTMSGGAIPGSSGKGGGTPQTPPGPGH